MAIRLPSTFKMLIVVDDRIEAPPQLNRQLAHSMLRARRASQAVVRRIFGTFSGPLSERKCSGNAEAALQSGF
jgi:hypothetical protein